MTIYAKLLRLPFFQGIDRDELEAMASKIRFDFQKYDEGAWIARENDRCATLTLVMTGSVEAEAISADPDRLLFLFLPLDVKSVCPDHICLSQPSCFCGEPGGNAS